ncbi:hypothetical protein LJC28_04815, partial [Dysgonomonas sp. OttesenSCG-928-D17]|nr:hypothetical protein [Dysgonomonas sp. OttesenSCG-928-D17]
MDELDLNYGISKGQKITNLIFSLYFAIFGLYILITQTAISNYGLLFFAGAICFIFAAIMMLLNTLWLPASILKINKEVVEAHLPKQKTITIEWVSVSSVNIGPGYLVFLVNGGQKQRKIELAELKYSDVMTVKSKVIELCEHKNISYHND